MRGQATVVQMVQMAGMATVKLSEKHRSLVSYELGFGFPEFLTSPGAPHASGGGGAVRTCPAGLCPLCLNR